MAKIPKERSRLRLEANGYQYILDNSLKGRSTGTMKTGTSPSQFDMDPFFAFGSAWIVDSNWSLPPGWSWFKYANGETQEQPSINLLRIDLVTKRVVAIIPLPRLGFIWFNSIYNAQGIVGIGSSDMCEGAGKLWLVFGNGAEGPWGAGYDTSEGAAYGDANDYAAEHLSGQYWPNTPPYRPRGEGHVRGLVYSIDPTSNTVKTINPLDNRVYYPQIAFGGGFIWVTQTPSPADSYVLNYYHGFSRQNWSPLLRIDPSSSYSLMIPQGQWGVPDSTPRHPTLRVFPDGLSEQSFPTYGNLGPPLAGHPAGAASAFRINEMVFGDRHLVMSTSFDGASDVFRVSRLNVSNLEVKKGPVFEKGLYKILFCPLNNTIWGAEYGNDYSGAIWVGDINLNFTKVPIVIDSWIGLDRPPRYDAPVTPVRVGFIFGLAFDGVEVFASMIVVSAWESYYYHESESVILRISPKSKAIKSVISFEMPTVSLDSGAVDGWFSGSSAIIRIIYAEDGVLWCNQTTGSSKTFPLKQGRFGGWKVGKI